MSIDTYVDGLSEDQLEYLIERATSRLQAIRDSGWVKLWVVGTENWNEGFYAMTDYPGAVAGLARLGKKLAREGKEMDLTLECTAYRPREAENNLLYTAGQTKKYPKTTEEK